MAGTLRDILNGAARDINVNQQNEVLNGENMEIALYALTLFVDSCSNNRLLIYNINEYVFPVTGAQTYSLGLGGDWDIPRPMKIETAYARLNNGTLQQLDIAMQPLTVLQYAGIAVKNTPSTFGFAYYDDNQYPLRNITLFPIPTGPGAVVLWLREPLIDLQIQAIALTGPITPGTLYTNGFYPNVALTGGSGTGAQANFTIQGGVVTYCAIVNAGTGYNKGDVLGVSPLLVGGTGSGFALPVTFVSGNLDTPINFPPGYERFFRKNLALEMCAEFGKAPSQDLILTAGASTAEIERLNKQPYYMRGDGGMSRSGRNRYFNFITGNFWSFGNN